MDDEIFVYDDDCGFCTWWAKYFQNHTDLQIIGYTQLNQEQKQRLPPDYNECSHLLTNEEVYSCGASFEQAVLRTKTGSTLKPLSNFLHRFRAYQRLREIGYHWIAHNRTLWGKILKRTPPHKQE